MSTEEHVTIQQLVGQLSDAYWRRITRPGVSTFEALQAADYRPQSDEEKAIWNQITAPSNYSSLAAHVEKKKARGITEFAEGLYQLLLTEAAQRLRTKDCLQG